jgi:hypothetical protein
MVALLASLLNMMGTDYMPDARETASHAFVVRFQEWLKDYENLYISPKGEVRFPFI